ncbi:MAG TPA: hypothetical protein VNT52_08450 [Acidimicrobiales bacterium]|nr:hypothetical protein [Acidimicrobiales bacterium]
MSDVREALRAWVRDHNPDVPAGEPADGTRLIECRYLTSLQVADLLLFIEELRQAPVDPASLKPGVFASIDDICAAFF